MNEECLHIGLVMFREGDYPNPAVYCPICCFRLYISKDGAYRNWWDDMRFEREFNQALENNKIKETKRS